MISHENLLITAIHIHRDLKTARKEGVLPEHFGEPRPRMAYVYFCKHADENDGAMPTEEMFLARTGFDLPQVVEGELSVKSLSKEVIRKAKVRAIEQTVPQVAEIEKDPDAVANRMFTRLREILASGVKADKSSAHNAVAEFIQQAAAGPPPELWGLPYPWNSLNEVTMGMHPGEWIIFYGRPGCMKTWTMEAIAVHVIRHRRRSTVLWYNCELDNDITKRRSICLLTKQPYDRIRKLSFQAAELADFQFLGDSLAADPGSMGNLLFVKPQTKNFDELLRTIDTVKPDLVCIDSVYKLTVDPSQPDSRNPQALASLSSEISSMLKARGIPGIGTVQANRTKAKDTMVGPGGGADVYSGDAISQDADVLIRLYPFYDDDDVERLLLEIGKIREARLGGLVVTLPPNGICDETMALRTTAAVTNELQKIQNQGKKARTIRVTQSLLMEGKEVKNDREDDEGGTGPVQEPAPGPDPELPDPETGEDQGAG